MADAVEQSQGGRFCVECPPAYSEDVGEVEAEAQGLSRTTGAAQSTAEEKTRRRVRSNTSAIPSGQRE